MPLSLVKRIPLGVPISAAQNDQNMTDIENAVNANTSGVAANAAAISTINTDLSTGSGNVYTKSQVDALVAGAGIDSAPIRALTPGTQVITTNGTPVTMVLDNTDLNADGDFDTATYTFTAPATGAYSVSLDAQFDNGTGDAATMEIGVGLAVNATPVSGGDIDSTPSPNGARWSPGFSQLVPLIIGDELTVETFAQDGPGTGNVTVTGAILSVFRVK